jgi:hypothetical protein
MNTFFSKIKSPDIFNILYFFSINELFSLRKISFKLRKIIHQDARFNLYLLIHQEFLKHIQIKPFEYDSLGENINYFEELISNISNQIKEEILSLLFYKHFKELRKKDILLGVNTDTNMLKAYKYLLMFFNFNENDKNYFTSLKILGKISEPVKIAFFPKFNDYTSFINLNLLNASGCFDIIETTLSSNKNIKTLVIKDKIESDFFFNFLGSNQSLSSLLIENLMINKHLMKSLSNSLSQNKSLKKLSIHSCSLMGKVKYLLVPLNINYYLQTLIFSYNHIHGDDIKILSEALTNNSSVTYLEISSNNLTDTEAKYLSQCIDKNTYLRELNLSNNLITHIGASDLLNRIISNSSFRSITLTNNPINNQVSKTLEKVRGQYTDIDIKLTKYV